MKTVRLSGAVSGKDRDRSAERVRDASLLAGPDQVSITIGHCMCLMVITRWIREKLVMGGHLYAPT
jgi:hypothetical protein